MPELQPLTIEVDFVRAGRVAFRATTWAGYIGILTGVRPGGFSVSVNYRRTEVMNEEPLKAFAKNLQRGLARHWPVSFLVRAALERCGSYGGTAHNERTLSKPSTCRLLSHQSPFHVVTLSHTCRCVLQRRAGCCSVRA